MEDKDLIEQVMQSVIDTIDTYLGGYTIIDMEDDILKKVNQLFFDYNPQAKKYSIVGDINGEQLIYSSDLCKFIANLKLKILNKQSFMLWENFRIIEQDIEF